MHNPAAPHDTLESRFQLLVEAVIDYGIFILDPTGRIVSWNTGAEKIQGYRASEIIGRHFSVFYPPEAIATGWPEEELRRSLRDGRLEDEGWRVRKDGSRFWANVTITPIFDAAGVHTGFAKITRDLTERRAHEEALRISEERFRLLVGSVRDYAIFMLDAEGFIRSWNAGAQAIKGYLPAEIIGRHFSTFYTQEDRAAGKPERALRHARAEGRAEDEGWRVRKDGTAFWANVVITAVHAPDGTLLGFAKVTRDMTERRRLEELERSSRRVNEFLAMLAHELRNPLAPIRNAVTVMQLETLPTPTLRNCRDIIDRQLTHVTRLVDDLLDVGRISTGKVKLRLEPLRIAEVVARGVEIARPLIEARHHRLAIELPDRPVYVQGDATRLTQILQNLLVNAAKYTPDGGEIRLTATTSGSFLNVAVADNGRGIEPGDLETIFELFRQGPADAPTESGLGIGLTLARALTEMHGGMLEAHSDGPGLGSTFTVRLPVAEERPEDAAHGGGVRGHGRRVLVVDDNRDSADSTTSILRLLGHEVEVAYAGKDALPIVPTFRPEVVLLDLAMPGMSGFDALAAIRGVPAGQKVFAIAMTGYGSAEDRRRTLEAGFDAHLTKPVELETLVGLLDQARERGGAGIAEPAPLPPS